MVESGFKKNFMATKTVKQAQSLELGWRGTYLFNQKNNVK